MRNSLKNLANPTVFDDSPSMLDFAILNISHNALFGLQRMQALIT